MEYSMIDGFWKDVSNFLLFLLLVFRYYLENKIRKFSV